MYLLDSEVAKTYKGSSQKIRVMSELWTGESIFCPSCGAHLERHENNRPVADFYCSQCRHDYELKAGTRLGAKVTDGAYKTMIERLGSQTNPSFFFMTYSDLEVRDFIVIPKHYFTSEIIERRKPLAATARRAGWVGCNILMSAIPKSGRIAYMKDGKIRAKDEVLQDWQKTAFLASEKSLDAKGWVLDTMLCIEGLKKKDFMLDELYAFEPTLKLKYRENNFIKDKLRQQLQILRDKGYLEFTGRGKYKVL